jgi:uncharacterized protein YndB with AHSA1/START domain
MPSKITVSATISAPIQKVWNYYTLPEHIVKWNFASPDWECPKATNDLQVGGKFVSTMAAKDGSVSFDFSGVYTKVEDLKQIDYKMDDNRTASVYFEGVDAGTLVKVVFDAENENPEEMQHDGWQAILENFKKHVEQN